MLAALTGGTVDLTKFVKDNYFAISCLIAIIAMVWKASNAFNNYKAEVQKTDAELLTKVTELKLDFKAKFDELSERLEYQEKLREEGKTRTHIIMNGVEATLMALHERGANGPVTHSLKELNQYKTEQACK